MSTLRRAAWFLLFVASGLLVFVVFSHYFPLLRGGADIAGRIVLGALLLGLALFARRSQRYRRYWLLPCAFFTALAAISIDYYLGLSAWILPALGITGGTPAALAIDKLESSLLGVAVVLLVNRLFGNSLGSIFWQAGRLRLALTVGLAVFVLMLFIVVPFATASFRGQDLNWGRILGWLPWMLVFVLANALNEELIFRGVLLNRLEPFVGATAAIFATAIPFTLSHTPTSYAADQLMFLGVTFVLAVVWGWLMQKTGSLWGAVLFHAGMDLPIVAGIFSTL